MARVIFMGTPQFAVPTLQALMSHHEVVAVVTQPDAAAGRGRALSPSPVKALAVERGVTVLQPESLKPPEVVDQLRAYAPDVIVVAAFGQILRRPVLELSPHGCVNVHASLLPRWRGASPISAAIAAGDEATGVTIMRMDAGLDTGPILSQRSEPIHPDDTAGALGARLAELGAALLIETLPGYLAGRIQPQPQDEARATKCGLLKKEDGRIDWQRGAMEIERHTRAMSPWPSAFTTWQGRLLRVLRAAVRTVDPEAAMLAPGAVFVAGKSICVRCGEDALELIEVQPEGKRPMAGVDFARGQRKLLGSRLGEEG
ncbi:MAG: methionyl-tRNA formyltransferase [Anaerolineae bacterium]